MDITYESSVEQIAEDFPKEEKLEAREHVMTINGVPWALRYTIGRCNIVEKLTGRSIMAMTARLATIDVPSLEELWTVFAGGLCKVEGGYASLPQGIEMAQKVMEAQGYGYVLDMVVYALQRDCPFFFRESSLT